MELLISEQKYLIVHGTRALECLRPQGTLRALPSVPPYKGMECLGVICGVVGVLKMGGVSVCLLVVARENLIGQHPIHGTPIGQLQRVLALPLAGDDSPLALDCAMPGPGDDASSLPLDGCPVHRPEPGDRSRLGLSLLQKGQKSLVRSTVTSLRFVANHVRRPSDSAKTTNRDEDSASSLSDVLRIFNETGSFYWVPAGSKANLTLSALQWAKLANGEAGASWVDDRFFWNSHMLSDLIGQSSSQPDLANWWIRPIMQGFVEIHSIPFANHEPGSQHEPLLAIPIGLALISRRSKFRAGTRYIKRGIQEDGNCANFVETEQLLAVGGHVLSFVQVRGSVPVYWSQPGYKYKPPPVLQHSTAENFQAFEKHFLEESRLYPGSHVVVNLVEETGKEGVLAEAYLDHILSLDCPDLTYIAFDFHRFCRGLQFHRVDTLLQAMEQQHLVRQIGFTWIDKTGAVACAQAGVARINCVDCLDRTNVVQAALATLLLERQLRKFGLLQPDEGLPPHILQLTKIMWANNGDSISRQYAGTAALKGDYTRTGQRNFGGLMRDGYHSASRYYLSHMKDVKRQAAIDLVLGIDPSVATGPGSETDSPENEEDEWLNAGGKEEQLRLLVQDCQRLIVPENEILLGGWALIDCADSNLDPSQDDMDTVVLLTKSAYYVADYEEEFDKFVDFQRVSLANLERMECGNMPLTGSRVPSLGRAKKTAFCIRIWYTDERQPAAESYFHVWRSASTRLFNNVALSLKNDEEAREYLCSIAEQFKVAVSVYADGGKSEFSKCQICEKLDRKKSRGRPGKEAGATSLVAGFGLFGPSTFYVKSLSTRFARELNPAFNIRRLNALRKGAGGLEPAPDSKALLSARAGTHSARAASPAVSPHSLDSQQAILHPEAGLIFSTARSTNAFQTLSTRKPPPLTSLPPRAYDYPLIGCSGSPLIGYSGSPLLARKGGVVTPDVLLLSPDCVTPSLTPALLCTPSGNHLTTGPEHGFPHVVSASCLQVPPDNTPVANTATESSGGDSNRLKISHSESSLKALSRGTSPEQDSTLKPLEGERGFLASSFSRLSNQMYSLRSSGKAGGSPRAPSPPPKPFPQFQERIAQSKSRIILL